MTHINAFYGNVDLKKQTLNEAKAELEEAERQLKAHPDYEEPKKDEPKEEVKEEKEDTKKPSAPTLKSVR